MQLIVKRVQDCIRCNELQNGFPFEEARVICPGLEVSGGEGLRIGSVESHFEGEYDPR